MSADAMRCCSALSLLLLVLLLLLLLGAAPVTAGTCPGDQLTCPGNNTCCRTDSDELPFICCPYAEAVCCADGRHCCRQGFTCDLRRDRCVRTAPEPGLCPDGRSRCPKDNTCCQMPDRRWGCCPYQHAVCCADMLHCCPQGTECDLETLTCIQTKKHPMLEIAGGPQRAAEGHPGLHA